MYEGEARTTRTNTGKMQLGEDYSMTLEDKGNFEDGIKTYFQCEKAVLDQMVIDGIDILWSNEIEEIEENI